MAGEFRVLVAIDGSPSAAAALATAIAFPWPAPSEVRGIIALDPGGSVVLPARLQALIGEALRRVAQPAGRALAARWSAARIVTRDQAPPRAIRSPVPVLIVP